MGDDISSGSFTREQRQRYREKVRRCLDVFEKMLAELEIELNLVDQHWQPDMANARVLEAIADPAFQTELGQYNIELNVPPGPLTGDSLLDLEKMLRDSMNHAESKANESGSDHSTSIFVLDVSGRPVATLLRPSDPKRIVADLLKLRASHDPALAQGH